MGLDGEKYEWTRVIVTEFRDGRLMSACEFDLEDEEEAFTYAEERVRAVSSRLAVTNPASEAAHGSIRALHARDVDAALAHAADPYVFDDRRRLSGEPIEGRAELRAALERLIAQFTRFEARTLAVRGERLALLDSRWSDDAGNETNHLHVFELGNHGG